MNDRDVTFTHARALQDLIRQYRQSQVLITCATLGVFRALAGGAKHAEELAAALDVRAESLRRLLNAATALGLLERERDRYRNSPATMIVLGEEGVGYLGHLFGREGAFYERWGHLTEAVRSGQSPEPSRRMEEAGGWVRGFEYALYDR
jgi:hypothetical protein